uniref:Polysaccharide lyase family 11 n=1 Tax=Neocallimastix frontalis TaxID=4757 RepID=A0A2S1TZD6_NEOFR|nr:Polysaccharide lyase family 11 [Neocallimastix frontalis]
MNKYFAILATLVATSKTVLAGCFSEALGYPCCSSGVAVIYTDNDGPWGVENNDWCGISNTSSATSCFSVALGYNCCQQTTEVVYVDNDGSWGIENGDWCGIGNSNNDKHEDENKNNATSENYPPTGNGKRRMERLNRGVVAMLTNDGIFISWRLLGTEDQATTTFNLYRDGTKLNNGAYALTNWTDKTIKSVTKDITYTVKAVVNGVEQNGEKGNSWTIKANTPKRQYIPIPLKEAKDSKGASYRVEHVYAGDLDGDGNYDFVVKRMSDNREPILLEAYKLDGTFLWRMNLGPNIETYTSSLTSPVLVYDFDGDGKAEVMVKTSEGTVFGDGTKIGDVNRDGKTDYCERNRTQYQVLTGPEFISMVDGMTGKEIDRVDFLERGNTNDWGDNYGNRMNFIFVTVAYLDGKEPSMVLTRGAGDLKNKRAITAYALKFQNRKFTVQWTFRILDYKNRIPAGHGMVEFHSIRALDLDGDGFDEIHLGGFAIDHDGKLLYSTELGHGDRFIIADIDPNRRGLEYFAVQQNRDDLLGTALLDAATGQTIWKQYLPSKADVGRGDAASILDTYGMQCWSSSFPGYYDAQRKQLTNSNSFPSLSIWWDGDLKREFLDGIGKEGYNPAINKWNVSKGSNDRLFTIYNDGGNYSVISPYSGRVPLYGDLIGDWREEIVLETANHQELRIYTTTIGTEYTIYTLMHNPAYRNCVNVKGYLQSTEVDYYLGYGADVKKIPKPDIYVK